MSEPSVILAGGSADALVAGAYLARRDRRVTLIDRHGSGSRSLATESFLTPYSFDLGLGFILRADPGDVIDEFAADLALLQPAVPLAVERPGSEPFCLYRDHRRTWTQLASARDRQQAQELVADGRLLRGALLGASRAPDVDAILRRDAGLTVRELLDAHDVHDAGLRCALTYMPLAFGLGIEAPGTGLAVPLLLAGLEHFVAVERGMSLLAQALRDDILGHGEEVSSSRHGQASSDGDHGAGRDGAHVIAAPRAALDGSLGLARSFVGGRTRTPSAPPGYLTVLGCPGEDGIHAHLSALRSGLERPPLGHVRVRTAPDLRGSGEVLVSAVWQGPCPAIESISSSLSAPTVRACRRGAGLERSDFELFWPPRETGSYLELPDWAALIGESTDHPGARGLASVAAATGLMTGRSLARALIGAADREGGSS